MNEDRSLPMVIGDPSACERAPSRRETTRAAEVATPSAPEQVASDGLHAQEPAAQQAGQPGDTYRTGYARPPMATRFRPGQSGNPRGRRKGIKNVATMMRKEFLEKIPIRVDGKLFRVTKMEAVIKRVAADAINGNPKAAGMIIAMGQQMDVLAKDEGGHMPSREDDLAIIGRYLERKKQEAEVDHGE